MNSIHSIDQEVGKKKEGSGYRLLMAVGLGSFEYVTKSSFWFSGDMSRGRASLYEARPTTQGRN